jgi:hypothetical protein
MKKLIFGLSLVLCSLKLFAPSHSEDYFKNNLHSIVNSSDPLSEVDRIIQTIRIIESNGNYDTLGQSLEKGAYQFQPATFKSYSLLLFKKELDINNPKHQDSVARYIVLHFIDKNYTPDQIASIWNCGSPRYEGKVGVNKYGVKYDVPGYVSKFLRIYNGLIS